MFAWENAFQDTRKGADGCYEREIRWTVKGCAEGARWKLEKNTVWLGDENVLFDFMMYDL